MIRLRVYCLIHNVLTTFFNWSENSQQEQSTGTVRISLQHASKSAVFIHDQFFFISLRIILMQHHLWTSECQNIRYIQYVKIFFNIYMNAVGLRINVTQMHHNENNPK